MIAVITSTLFANSGHSFFTNDERLAQTIKTIETLDRLNFNRVYLFDNSLQQINREPLLRCSSKLEIYQTPQYTFKNKGLSEALLILNNLHHLPDNTPIFKISGRYHPTANFNVPDFNAYPGADFIGVGKIHNEKLPFVSTRAFYVKNKQTWETMLVTITEEMLAYSRSIHGIRSMYESIVSCFKPYMGAKYQLSLEQAFARILRWSEKFHLLENIGIEGYIAGSDRLEKIEE
jgi:hypothetical protein